MPGKKYISAIHRRKFLSNALKLAVIGSILPVEACSNKSEKSKSQPEPQKPQSKKTGGKNPRRKTWSHESFVLNTKTNKLHYPTAVLYTYYDEIKPNHLREINKEAWKPGSENAPTLNKKQSGNITEILTLQELAKDISDNTITKAIDTLSIAFRNEYEKENIYNFRLHELMLLLIALNSSIAGGDKWNVFNSGTKRPSGLRKRQAWMENENNFNERVKYIQDRRNEYITRLGKRAAKYFIS